QGITDVDVCTGTLTDHLAGAAAGLGGEAYDLDSKTVAPKDPGWITVASAGSAAAKLRLLGYGPQSSETTPDQRQATLKMITADYCGDGTSYTENGTPVLWENVGGSVHVAGEASSVESVW